MPNKVPDKYNIHETRRVTEWSRTYSCMRDHICNGMVKYLFKRDHIYNRMVKYFS